MGFNAGGGVINWFPGHMAAATRALRHRLKLADLVIEVRDYRIPLSSAHADLLPQLSAKRRIIALNKKDLANPNIMHNWIHYFNSCKQDCDVIPTTPNLEAQDVMPQGPIIRSMTRKLALWFETKSSMELSKIKERVVIVIAHYSETNEHPKAARENQRGRN